MTEASALEALLLRDRLMVAAGLGGAVVLAWVYLALMLASSGLPAEHMMALMTSQPWDAQVAVLVFLMWVVMMLGMMLPSAAPTLLLYATVLRKSPGAGSPVPRTYAFAVGYLCAWTLFSALATLLQWGLAEAELLTPMLASRSPMFGGLLLAVAGLYQWTPLKRGCLDRCRSPAAFISSHWQPGVSGAFRMGCSHGFYCVGCCWGLMLLLFVGGAMNLAWVAAITALVLFEKLVPLRAGAAPFSGLLLLLASLFLFSACSGKPVPQIARLPADATILAFGDSLTFGTGTTTDKAYPAALAQITGRKVVNAGVPGETTEEGRARLPAVLDEVQPRLVILCLGGNDMLRQQDRGRMRDNLDAMIREIRARGMAVVLLGVPEPKLLSRRAEPIYTALAEQHRLPLEGEMLGEVLGDGALKSDPVHPNAEGYREMAAAVARLLKRAGAV